ncbi:uncharacterized protein LOC120669828 [Panicum virgatum]|uniref:Myb/SANT-like domain-containing protein n=1 Tax=Panicum virgatum TaxID=38727 RepID=A0A8T0T329_PANVG|nr:uncharacterized protein LOC120669828 [Panicum virgatum]KAG2604737.1 hypothetical protein PVAP13_4NG145257 [Panicum virgatum]
MEGDGSRNFFPNFRSNPSSFAAGFDLFSQASATGRVHAPRAAAATGLGGFDLNSEDAAATEFAHLADYSNLLRSDDVEDAAAAHDFVHPPPRATRTVGVPTVRNGGTGNVGRPPVRGRQLNFVGAGSRSAGAGGSGSPMPLRGTGSRGNAAAMSAPARQRARGSDRRNVRGRGGRAASAATTNHRQAQAAAYENIESGDEDEDINEHLGNSGGSMIGRTKANWSDENCAKFLRLCIEQLRLGNYVGGQMNGSGYQAIIDGYYLQTGLKHDRQQMKNEITQLKSLYSFWRVMQAHTGLGRIPDGSVDAESNWWKKIQRGNHG